MWTLLLLAATVQSFAHMPLGISDRNTTTAHSTVGQGLQTFLSEGHISYYLKVSGSGIIIIWNVNVSGWATFYQINMFFIIYIMFTLLTECLCVPGEMALRQRWADCQILWSRSSPDFSKLSPSPNTVQKFFQM